ncbi:MAG TPA: Stk1 family PASTA domain-containing Ser/Thr kinase [Rubrobacteraceae bacterium]|nr:Stk1 family PASTA domain-containing Ser/Thr kinase [Rubrobacteraceae bacterium]
MQQLVDNRYRVTRPLGSGGMAEVYLAHDDVLERDVALKVMSSRYALDEEFVERFKREAQSAAALSHPNIVSIFDRGESKDGMYYIAMEYLPGGTLKDRIVARGALPARTAAAVALQIAQALKAAHERGVIHRDIKPHNILITDSGDVKVTDFGIARAASSSTMTRTGSILGTAHYISPEQAMGEPVGPASDLYSLGVVLYEMLTGELPYDADTPLGIAMKHVNGHLRPPREVDPSISDGINAITCRLLAKEPLDRYANDDELIEDLERVVAGLEPSGATTEMMTQSMPTAPTRAVPPPRRDGGKKRRRFAPLILALLALLLLAPLAWAGYNYLQDQREPDVPRIGVPDMTGMTLEEARNEHGEDFEIEVDNEINGEQPVGTILSQDPEGGRAERGSTISVDVVGTRVAEVPGVVGEGRDAARSTLEEAGFEVAVEEEESSFEEEGTVTQQDPEGGSQEEYGSQVTMTVGTGPASVEVPDLTGNNVDQATALLDDAGLELGAQVESYSDATAWTIISQDPGAGSEAEPGSAVDVTISIGPEPVVVPDVVGNDVDAAAAEITNSGLSYQTFEYQGDEPEGTVVSTDPGAGTELEPGTLVAIYYSTGPPPPAQNNDDNSTGPPPPAQNNADNNRAEAQRDAREKANEARQKALENRENGREGRNGGGRGGGGD